MKPERWQEIERLCHTALERDGSKRAAFLEEACRGDESLRREVEFLLEQEGEAEDFLEAPALEVAAQAYAERQVLSMLGKEISSYKILSLLGSGGMGEVYLAEDMRLDRKVALKFLPRRCSEMKPPESISCAKPNPPLRWITRNTGSFPSRGVAMKRMTLAAWGSVFCCLRIRPSRSGIFQKSTSRPTTWPGTSTCSTAVRAETSASRSATTAC